MTPSPRRYLFGPVHSRRMGWSLGLDLVTAKTCSYHCPFCQIGATTNLTLRRREYVPMAAVLAELDDWLGGGGAADFITLAGSGEPTLHSGFGKLLTAIRSRCRIRTALLSNGSLFYQPAVRRSAAAADVVKASLSSWDQASFQVVNRPHPDLSFTRIYRGLGAFRRQFAGEFWIEVFLLAGVNSTDAAVARIAALVAALRPDQVQLNTVIRPPAEPAALAVDDRRLHQLAACFTPPAIVLGGAGATGQSADTLVSRPDQTAAAAEQQILAVVQRHPGTAAEIAVAAGLPRKQIAVLTGQMLRRGKLCAEWRRGRQYFMVRRMFKASGD